MPTIYNSNEKCALCKLKLIEVDTYGAPTNVFSIRYEQSGYFVRFMYHPECFENIAGNDYKNLLLNEFVKIHKIMSKVPII